MSNIDSDALALLAQIAVDVRALRIEAERGRSARPAGRSQKPGDRKAIEFLIAEIVRSIGVAVVFTIRDLLDRARSDDKQLQAALERAFGENLDNGVARRLGDIFKRCAGIVHGGFRIERAGIVREGALWTVQRE